MNNRFFLTISPLGGAAFFIRCIEECIKYYQLNQSEWQFTLNKMWKVVDCGNYADLEDWDRFDGEITPFVILENIPFEKKGLRRINNEEHDSLKNLYLKTPKLILDTIDDLFFIVPRIIGSNFKEFSLDLTEKISEVIAKLEEKNISLPDITLLQNSKISENNGLGTALDKYMISQLLS